MSKEPAANANKTEHQPKGTEAFNLLDSTIQEAVMACRNKLIAYRQQEDSYRATLRSTLADIYKLRCRIRESSNEFNSARFVVATLDDKKFKELTRLENLELELVKGYMAPADAKDASYFSRVLKGLTAMNVGADDAMKALNDNSLRDIAKKATSDSNTDKVTAEALQAKIVAAPSLAEVSFTDKAVVPDKPFLMLAAPTKGGGAAVKAVFDEDFQKKLFELILAEETRAANAAKKAEKQAAKLAKESAKSAVSLFPVAKAA